MVHQDFKDIGTLFDEQEIKKETNVEFKSRIKKLLRIHMFEDLKSAQKEHSKISNICYQTFKVQDYLKHTYWITMKFHFYLHYIQEHLNTLKQTFLLILRRCVPIVVMRKIVKSIAWSVKAYTQQA